MKNYIIILITGTAEILQLPALVYLVLWQINVYRDSLAESGSVVPGRLGQLHGNQPFKFFHLRVVQIDGQRHLQFINQSKHICIASCVANESV